MAQWSQANREITVTDPTGVTLATIPTGDAASTYIEALALADDGRSLLMVEDRQESDGWVGYLVRLALPGGERSDEQRLGPWGYRLALSADGSRLAIGDARGGLRVIDPATGTEVWRAPDDPTRRAITALELSADGKTLRVGARMGSVLFGKADLLTFDLGGGTAADPVKVDTDRISAIATSPDDAWVVIAASDDQSVADGRLLVYAPGDPESSGSLGPPGDDVVVLRFDRPGHLLSGGPRSAWMAWTVDPGAWARQACAIAARNLTPTEWRDALGDEPWAPTCPTPGASPSPSVSPGPARSPAPASPAASMSPRLAASPGPSAAPGGSIRP